MRVPLAALALAAVPFPAEPRAGPPARAALMTGQYGPRTGIYTVGSPARFDTSSRPLIPVPNVVELGRDTATVAQALRKAGYATGIFGKWHLGQKAAGPKHHGFDEA